MGIHDTSTTTPLAIEAYIAPEDYDDLEELDEECPLMLGPGCLVKLEVDSDLIKLNNDRPHKLEAPWYSRASSGLVAAVRCGTWTAQRSPACEDDLLSRSVSVSRAAPSSCDLKAQAREAAAEAKLAAAPWHVRAASAVAVAAVYIAVSAMMIIFNKFLMRADRFPFATALTTMHQVASLFFANTIRFFAPHLFPAAASIFGGARSVRDVFQGLLPFAPIGVCGAGALVAGNWAYRYADVAFLQMVKESHIVFVYGLMLVFGLEAFSVQRCVVLGFVAVSATFAVCGEAFFSPLGLSLQMFAGLCGSMQIVLTNRMMVNSGHRHGHGYSGGRRVDPLSMVLCTAPVMLIALAPANILFWDKSIPARFVASWHYLLLNTLLAFALQCVMATTIKTLSGTGHALASVLKDLMIVFSASSVLHERLGRMQLMGFGGSVVGIMVYSAMKLFPDRFSPPRKKIDL